MNSDTYEGKATIADVYTNALEEWQIHPKNGPALTDEEAASAFNVCFRVKTPNGDEYTLDPLEVSVRELTGKLLEAYASRVSGRLPTQTDVTVSTLHRLKLINEKSVDHIIDVFNTIGREVEIRRYVTKSQSGDKEYVHTNFSFGPKKLSQSELMAKIARLQGKPVPAAQHAGDAQEEAPF